MASVESLDVYGDQLGTDDVELLMSPLDDVAGVCVSDNDGRRPDR